MPNFPKNERLNSRTQILNLLHAGKSSKSGAIKIIWDCREKQQSDTHNIEAAFSVPKRQFKQAVKRNRIKRKMREIFRLNKKSLLPYLETNEQILSMLIIYLNKEELSYNKMEKQILKNFEEILYSIKYENLKKYSQ
jgi:ribonuclease P protein component